MTTAGGIEEDLIKCLAHTYLGDFNLSGKELRQRGINRLTVHSMNGQIKNFAGTQGRVAKILKGSLLQVNIRIVADLQCYHK